MKFGVQLKKYMQDHGIQQRFVARKVDMTDSQFSKVLLGHSNIFIDDVLKILTVLNVKLDFIMQEQWKAGENNMEMIL